MPLLCSLLLLGLAVPRYYGWLVDHQGRFKNNMKNHPRHQVITGRSTPSSFSSSIFPQGYDNDQDLHQSGTISSTTTALGAVPSKAVSQTTETEVNAKIAEAAKLCNVALDDLTIEWKPGQIIITVASNAVYLSNNEILSDEDAELLRKAYADGSTKKFLLLLDPDEVDDDASSSSSSSPPPSSSASSSLESANKTEGVDLTELARAINTVLAGSLVCETHEVQVTTPGAPDELSGIMWQSYRGFDVIATYTNPKTKQVQSIEGRLVERNDEHTVLNLKGRMKKLQNEYLQSVRLPKAKA